MFRGFLHRAPAHEGASSGAAARMEEAPRADAGARPVGLEGAPRPPVEPMAATAGEPVDAPGPVAPVAQTKRPATGLGPGQVPQDVMEVQVETEEGATGRKAAVARGGEDGVAGTEAPAYGRVAGPPLQMEVAKDAPPAPVDVPTEAHLPNTRIPVGGRRGPRVGADERPGADARLPVPPYRVTAFRVGLVSQGRLTVLEEEQEAALREAGWPSVRGPRDTGGGLGLAVGPGQTRVPAHPAALAVRRRQAYGARRPRPLPVAIDGAATAGPVAVGRQEEERPGLGPRQAGRRFLTGALGVGPAPAVGPATVLLVEAAAVAQAVNGPENTRKGLHPRPEARPLRVKGPP